MNRRKATVQIIILVVVIALGVLEHIYITPNDPILKDIWESLFFIVVAELLAHFVMFEFEYGSVFEAIRHNLPTDGQRHGITVIRDMEKSLRELRQTSIALEVVTHVPEQWLLSERLEEIRSELQRNLMDLKKGHYEIQMTKVVNTSLEICVRTKRTAFCTSLQSQSDIFTEEEQGSDKLLAANFDLAGRLPVNQFTRVFILDSFEAVPEAVYEVMASNYRGQINVLVITRDDLKTKVLTGELHDLPERKWDLGLWDDEFVVNIRGTKKDRTMRVSYEEDDLREARRLREQILPIAKTWKEFNLAFLKPPNNWSKLYSDQILHLSPPNGPGSSDVQQIFAAAREGLPQSGGSIAVLGLTGAFLQHALAEARGPNHRSVSVVERRMHPADLDSTFHYEQCSWLEWTPKNKYNVVIGDDVLCNLRYWQIPLFFKAVSDALVDGGSLIVRTTLRPSEGDLPTRPDFNKRIAELHTVLESRWRRSRLDEVEAEKERSGSVYELVWPLLHTAPFYKRDQRGFDLTDWDHLDIGRKSFRKYGESFYHDLTLPVGLKMTSMHLSELEAAASNYFRLHRLSGVESIWAENPVYSQLFEAGEIAELFKKCYSILVFKKIRS